MFYKKSYKNLKNNLNFIKKLNPLFLITPVLKQIPISLIIGSTHTFFSITQLSMPTITHSSLVSSLLYCTIQLIIPIKFHISTLYHIPTLFQIFYLHFAFSNKKIIYKIPLHKVFAIIICLACLILFILHPTGGKAFPYTIFWVIPMILAFIKEHKSFFLYALSGTLISHAVGSILWLYFKMPLSPKIWLGLIPLVLIERLTFALGATAIHYGYKILQKHFADKAIHQIPRTKPNSQN